MLYMRSDCFLLIFNKCLFFPAERDFKYTCDWCGSGLVLLHMALKSLWADGGSSSCPQARRGALLCSVR